MRGDFAADSTSAFQFLNIHNYRKSVLINNEEAKTCPYSIFNRVGELIQVGEINEQTQKIDLRSSIPRIYFVSLEIDGKIIVKKLIKI